MKNQPWSQQEVSATVRVYLEMLIFELAGQKYVKRHHNRQLQELLDGRSLGAIEMKHMNISAALNMLGCHYIAGYKPYANLQGLLLEEVALQVNANDRLHRVALEASERTTHSPLLLEYENVLAAAPVINAKKPAGVEEQPLPNVRLNVDYQALEQRNRSLGLAGEEFVVEYERWWLKKNGAGKLAANVIHTSQEEGDGAGYDIKSFDLKGNEQFIEVKTTAYTEMTPFWITANEVRFSQAHQNEYKISRVFDFRQEPRLFELPGSVDSHGVLRAETYKMSLF